MKFQTNTFLANISRKDVKSLTTIVKETLDTRKKSNDNKFSAADLWMIHRQRRNFSVRRYL